ncbi:MAG: Tfx family DNA-binding protein, partial [Staphylothermus sp.]|nr:Tfx family DNA-binding protein [Staphylothermus sp.]
VLGYKPDKIAEILGISRSSVYAAIKRAKNKSETARRTIDYYNGLTKPIKISVKSGEDLRDVIERIFLEADSLGLKLPFRSIEIVEELCRMGIAEDEQIVRNSTIIIIPGIGIYHVE